MEAERRGWSIESVMRLAESGDHWLAHYVLARKLLGEPAAFAVRVANAFGRHRLTREECEGMIAEWRQEFPQVRGAVEG